jgi:ABC-2 type transport system ATP-binding protein
MVGAEREEGRNDMGSAIEAKSLRKSYKTVSVLDDVSFSVQRGTVFALLGSNGAGKTTTINILTTLIKADGGAATVAGHDVASRPDKVREQISLTGQFAAVDHRLTGRENLRLIGALRHVADPAGTAADLLRRFGLEEAADRRVATYSGGMVRRLDIAMGLIGSPTVIFLDEPTTGFDPEARNEMWRTIRELAAGGTTVFLTTQYLDEADELADDIAILHQGRIVAGGSAAELKKLVPGGLIELTFHDAETRAAAAQALGESYACREGEGATLTITTDGAVADVAGAFAALRDARIEPTEFAQKVASLDDAFLKIVGGGGEGS